MPVSFFGEDKTKYILFTKKLKNMGRINVSHNSKKITEYVSVEMSPWLYFRQIWLRAMRMAACVRGRLNNILKFLYRPNYWPDRQLQRHFWIGIIRKKFNCGYILCFPHLNNCFKMIAYRARLKTICLCQPNRFLIKEAS